MLLLLFGFICNERISQVFEATFSCSVIIINAVALVYQTIIVNNDVFIVYFKLANFCFGLRIHFDRKEIFTLNFMCFAFFVQIHFDRARILSSEFCIKRKWMGKSAARNGARIWKFFFMSLLFGLKDRRRKFTYLTLIFQNRKEVKKNFILPQTNYAIVYRILLIPLFNVPDLWLCDVVWWQLRYESYSLKVPQWLGRLIL